MNNEGVFYRRNLPHIHPKDATFFITFLLDGTIPLSVLKNLREESNKQVELMKQKFSNRKLSDKTYNINKKTFGKIDNYLDTNSKGPTWLSKEALSQIVADKMHEMDGIRYKLIAYTIMCNHVHLLINTTGFNASISINKFGKTKNYPLADTMRLLKGSTSRACNKSLGRKGAFWHHESYDHFVRNEEELNRIVKYIVNNPVKAGLVDDWQDWKFTFFAGG